MDQKRLLLATVLSMAILIGWQVAFPPADPPATVNSGDEATAESALDRGPSYDEADYEAEPDAPTGEDAALSEGALSEDGSAAAPPLTPEEYEAAERETTSTLEGERFVATFTNRGAQLISFELTSRQNPDGSPIDLVRARTEAPYPFAITAPSGKSIAITDALFIVDRTTGANGLPQLSFRYSGREGRARKTFSLREDGLLDVDVRYESASPWSVVMGPGIQNPSGEEVINRFAAREVVYRQSGGVERIDARKADEREVIAAEELNWVGLQDNYFLVSYLPEDGLAEFATLPRVATRLEGSNRIDRFDPDNEVDDSEEASRELLISLRPEANQLRGSFYIGAKSYDRLSALPGGLEETLDFGFFAAIAKPLLFALLWIHDNVVRNYGWAIVILTTLIKLLLFPLTHKSQVSMQKMQEVNPKIQAIRSKYKSKLKDKQGRPNVDAQRKMNQEVMELYKTEGVNPAGGCLPMLLQLPVFFAFYSVLGSAGELRGAPWIGWILDLSAKDPYFVLPIVMGASQFVQQRITPMGGDPMQRRMMQLLPIFFTFIFLGMPSGLVLYWLTNNILTAIQMLIYRRYKERKEAAATT